MSALFDGINQAVSSGDMADVFLMAFQSVQSAVE